MNRVDIDNLYTNLFLISISRRFDFAKCVELAEQETTRFLESVTNYQPKGYEGLFFMESLARKMGSSIGEAYGLSSYQQEEIVNGILKQINPIGDAYAEYFDDSCDDCIEFQGTFSFISEKEEEIFKYYHTLVNGSTDDISSIYSFYRITFQKFPLESDESDCKYSISISVINGLKSEHMYECFEVWAGNKGVPADFIEEVIKTYYENREQGDTFACEERVDDEVQSEKINVEVDKTIIETNILPDSKRCEEELVRYVFDNTRTVDLLNQFEGIGQLDKVVYKRLVIENGKYSTFLNGERITFNLVIERGRGNDSVGDVTFTQFKKGEAYGLEKHIDDELRDEIIERYKNKDRFYRFSKPYLLRAQNSLNRTGYGWEWDWSGGYGDYTEGTLYGETTNYFFVGVYVTAGDYSYKPETRKPFEITDESKKTVEKIADKSDVIIYSGKLSLLTHNKTVRRFLKIKTDSKGDKYIPASVDEETQTVYLSEAVCMKYKDKIMCGDFEMKKNFID